MHYSIFYFKIILNSVSTCTAAVHNFQNPMCMPPLGARQICGVVNGLLLQIFSFATVKLKAMLLAFLCLGINDIYLSN